MSDEKPPEPAWVEAWKRSLKIQRDLAALPLKPKRTTTDEDQRLADWCAKHPGWTPGRLRMPGA